MPSDPLSDDSGGSRRPPEPSRPSSDQQTQNQQAKNQQAKNQQAKNQQAKNQQARNRQAQNANGGKDVQQAQDARRDIPAQGTTSDSSTSTGVPAQARPEAHRRPAAGRGPAARRTASGRPAASRGIATLLLAIGDSWSAVLFFGCVSLVLGVAALIWPGRTLDVVAVLFALQILVYGVFYVAQAIAAEDIDGGRRVLVALIGVVALVVGVLMLRDVTHTIGILALLLGLFWIVDGVVTIVSAFVGRARPGRGLALLAGFLGIVAGIVVLAFPDLSLTVLVLVLGIWLLVFGALTIGVALQIRAAGRATRSGRTGGRGAVAAR